MQTESRASSLLERFAEVQLIFYKVKNKPRNAQANKLKALFKEKKNKDFFKNIWQFQNKALPLHSLLRSKAP